MKKFILGLVLLGLFGVQIESSFAITSSNYWQKWIKKMPSRYRRYRPTRFKKRKWGPSYYRNRKKYRTESANTGTYFQAKKVRITPRRKIYRSRDWNYSNTLSTKKSLALNIVPIRQSQSISTIDSTPIRIFQLGVQNTSKTHSTDFMEAILLKKMTFQIFSNSGIASDMTNFDLLINHEDWDEPQSFQFENNGAVTVSLGNARVAKGETMQFDISIRVHDSSSTPHISGNLRVRLLRAEASTESSNIKIKPNIVGNAMSKTILFAPTPYTTGNSSLSIGETQQIWGKTLSAGESAFVLALDFEAYYDDMLIEKITLTDSLSNNKIDSFVKTIQAIDLDTGKILKSSRFITGSTSFYFRPAVQINRGSHKKIGFKVYLANRIKNLGQNSQFKLEVSAGNTIVRGIGSGREVPNSSKNFQVDSQTFTVAQSGGGMTVASSSNQPSNFAVTGGLEPVYRFKISNPSSRYISIGRISMDIRLQGLEFPNGRSIDDFLLRQVVKGREINGTAFTPVLGANNIVIFDTDNELSIGKHSEVEFVLKLKLDDVNNGQAQNDAVAVRILNDSSLITGSLLSVRSSGANFIWSDQSASPHSQNSSDWLSGYLLQGLSTNTTVNYRR